MDNVMREKNNTHVLVLVKIINVVLSVGTKILE